MAKPQQFLSDRLLAPLFLFAVLAVTALVYWPGLPGPFIFDDFGNLDKLGSLGGIRSWDTFSAFVFGGHAGPTGRPISLASFVLNAQDWPADPFAFKVTNLLIHLACGCLVYIVSRQILVALDIKDRKLLLAVPLIATFIWLVHPFLVSTTLYVVQRMAQLAALFCYLGMAAYLYGRIRLTTQPRTAYVWMSMGIALGTVLAVFSKENGALLPLLVLILEFTLFSSRNHRPDWRWIVCFLLLPSVAILGYLVWRAVSVDMFHVSSHRGFSIYERLLTEGRIVAEYLRLWFAPKIFTAGVFQDAYPKSTGLLNPAGTLWALAFHALTITLLIWWRKKYKLLAFSGLFFYGSHLIESTTVSLELYFEHRNYLGTAFLFLPIVVFIYKNVSGKVFALSSLGFLALLSTMTFQAAKVWASYDSLVFSWAAAAPESPRAQQQAAMQLLNRGLTEQSKAVTDAAVSRIPDDLNLMIWKLVVDCKTDTVRPVSIETAVSLASRTAYDLRALVYYQTLIEVVKNSGCRELGWEQVNQVVEALLRVRDNANVRSARYAQIQYLLGIIAINTHSIAKAEVHFQQSLQSRPSPDAAMNMAAQFANTANFESALVFSDKAVKYIEGGRIGSSGWGKDDYLHQIKEFQHTVKAELAASK